MELEVLEPDVVELVLLLDWEFDDVVCCVVLLPDDDDVEDEVDDCWVLLLLLLLPLAGWAGVTRLHLRLCISTCDGWLQLLASGCQIVFGGQVNDTFVKPPLPLSTQR